MKALIIRAHGDLSQLGIADMPEPTAAEYGEVRVKLRASALNHLDLWTLRGLPGLALTFPHILGADGAGTVDEVGPGVTTVQPGDRVMMNPGISCYRCLHCLAGEHSLCDSFMLLGEHLSGTLAEYVTVPQHNLAVIPVLPPGQEELSWSEAAAFSLVTLTAWRMLLTRAQLQPGETVLVWGFGGGVSSAALMIAKHTGAHVIVTSSSDVKLNFARSLGADATVNHAQADVVREVRQLTGKRGVDVVVENVGEVTWEQSLRVLAKGGRLVTCGATTGPRAETDIRRMFWNQWTLMGSTMGSASEYHDIVKLLSQGHLRPIVDSTFPIGNAVEAFERLQSERRMGKVVVEME
jgi:NADPH:quinone reductase-like Zn-dependent oxidoreductase